MWVQVSGQGDRPGLLLLHLRPPEQLRAVAQLPGPRGHLGAVLPAAGSDTATLL